MIDDRTMQETIAAELRFGFESKAEIRSRLIEEYELYDDALDGVFERRFERLFAAAAEKNSKRNWAGRM